MLMGNEKNSIRAKRQSFHLNPVDMEALMHVYVDCAYLSFKKQSLSQSGESVNKLTQRFIQCYPLIHNIPALHFLMICMIKMVESDCSLHITF